MLTVIDEEKHPSEHHWLGLLVYFLGGEILRGLSVEVLVGRGRGQDGGGY